MFQLINTKYLQQVRPNLILTWSAQYGYLNTASSVYLVPVKVHIILLNVWLISTNCQGYIHFVNLFVYFIEALIHVWPV